MAAKRARPTIRRRGTPEDTTTSIGATAVLHRIMEYEYTRFRRIQRGRSVGQWFYVKQITKREYDSA